MKRTLITSLLASALLFGGGCSDDFDDSALWKGVDEIYNQLTELEKQADQLNDQIRLLSSIQRCNVSIPSMVSAPFHTSGHCSGTL